MIPAASTLPVYLKKRHAAWKASDYKENSAWFHNLAAEGQHPRTMLVTCCDSRVPAVEIFGAEPGDLFVVRNVANLIPPHEPDHAHHGTSAAVEFAVNKLKVAHIVVIGHSGCGGVKACHDMCAGDAPELAEGPSYVGRWMDILRPGYETVVAKTEPGPERLAALEREAVKVSIRNLLTFPFVSEKLDEGTLSLAGAWFEIATGDLLIYDPKTGGFA
ncbi:MAG: carbonic anhydrase [Pseudomonadota bacterium]